MNILRNTQEVLEWSSEEVVLKANRKQDVSWYVLRPFFLCQ